MIEDREIPDNIKEFCKGFDDEYCGVFEGQYVYSVRPQANPNELYQAPRIGFPAYLLVSPETPNQARQVSDRTFKITNAISEQREELRKQRRKAAKH